MILYAAPLDRSIWSRSCCLLRKRALASSDLASLAWVAGRIPDLTMIGDTAPRAANAPPLATSGSSATAGGAVDRNRAFQRGSRH
ncbi:hypothetical protein POSPLADRAFT_1039732 [Postia placenta MAD-698-R-SB12]|uniref:Uncharacterized protein n=1 Tax=Postia placenta MAD-698-R-SB12 TaxID=670580 RepID=A0A1X6N2E7_9APHY|nr:hypothetical protein POSPLADRAFT_1039732 [Postia placenta MAD-698-R-SB12]OSX62774.1 hypothetical protein POSPLADRAFT_1039732 [Postia placenta MAD-698-R-SB12]